MVVLIRGKPRKCSTHTISLSDVYHPERALRGSERFLTIQDNSLILLLEPFDGLLLCHFLVKAKL